MDEKRPCPYCGTPIFAQALKCRFCKEMLTPERPASPVLIDRDREHLRLLSIFYYVFAGLMAFGSLIPVFHLIMGILMLNSPNAFGGPGSGPPTAFAWLFILFPAAFIVLGETFALCTFFAGRNLSRFRSRGYCLAIAGIMCLMMPLGTILGVFSLVVLIRPSVKALFEREEEALTGVSSP